MARKSLFTHVKHSVVPVTENDHHPHLLKREVLIAVLAIAVFLEALALTNGFAFFRKDANLASVLPAVLTALTNDARGDERLVALAENETLAKAAQLKADDMARYSYFSHTGPDGSLPWKWFKEAGYSYQYAGENLAVNFSDSDEVVDAWLNSPTHRANIMKHEFTETGIGMSRGTYKGKNTIFVVQFFAKPAQGAPSVVAVGNAADVSADELFTSGEVLGTSTVTIVERFAASPMTTSKYIFYGLAGLFVLVLLLGLLFGRRLPKFSATIGALLVIAVLLGFVILNKEVLLGENIVDNEAQAVE